MSQLQNIQNKIASRTAIVPIVEEWKRTGQRVVFTNGCFDILHQGHVVYLAKAHDQGDKLVLGLNSDASVKRLGKDPNRPINPEGSRAITLAGLASVDAIVLFDDDTPLELINKLKPDVLAKGADYNPNETDPGQPNYMVGANEVRSWHGSVVAIDLEHGHSTTNLIDRIKNG